MTYSFTTFLVDCLISAEQAMIFTIKPTPGNKLNDKTILLKKPKVHTESAQAHTLLQQSCFLRVQKHGVYHAW